MFFFIPISGGDKPLPGPTINIATNYKSVSQSSESGSFRPASLAVDGNRNTISHTAQLQNQWWKMEFDQPVTIARVKIWNRPDCCGLYTEQKKFTLNLSSQISANQYLMKIFLYQMYQFSILSRQV